MNLRKRLEQAANEALKEGIESSKDIINTNVVAGFDDMGMANVQPGEFAQGEITDKENLVNKGEMSNDTDFNKEENPLEKTFDSVTDMLTDLVDISEPEVEGSLEIIKTADDANKEHEVPCLHKMHHIHIGEAKLEEDATQPLFMYNPQLTALYTKWHDLLADPNHSLPNKINPDVILDLENEGLDPKTCKNSEFVWHDMNNEMGKYETKYPEAWDSLVNKLLLDAQSDETIKNNIDSSTTDFTLLRTEPKTRYNALRYNYGESAMAKVITKLLDGKSCEQYLKEAVALTESDYAGPRDWNPDTRINASDVLNAIKQEVGEGSEGVHVVKDLDERKDPIYRVTQIDKEKLPKVLKVETIELKWEDDAYRPQSETKEAPLPR